MRTKTEIEEEIKDVRAEIVSWFEYDDNPEEEERLNDRLDKLKEELKELENENI